MRDIIGKLMVQPPVASPAARMAAKERLGPAAAFFPMRRSRAI
jgi:hypothetical protein